MKRTIILLAAVLMPLLASAQLNITSETQTYKTLASARMRNVSLTKSDEGFVIATSGRYESIFLRLGNTTELAKASIEDLIRMIDTMSQDDYTSVYSFGRSIMVKKYGRSTLALTDINRRHTDFAYLYRGELNKFLNAIKRYESTTN